MQDLVLQMPYVYFEKDPQMSAKSTKSLLFMLLMFNSGSSAYGAQIDRQALVERHNIKSKDMFSVFALGNGEFCFGVDGTGLHTFTGNALAHWAKHSVALPKGITKKDIPETGTFDQGHPAGPMKAPERYSALGQWMCNNPHPVNMGHFSFVMQDESCIMKGLLNDPLYSQYLECNRTLDLWRGIHSTAFKLKGKQVHVQTLVLPDSDTVVVRVESELLSTGELSVALEFPYPYPEIKRDNPYLGVLSSPERHKTVMTLSQKKLTCARKMDDDRYQAVWALLKGNAEFEQQPKQHRARLIPSKGTSTLEFLCSFAPENPKVTVHDFDQAAEKSSLAWKAFWESGGAIDLSGSSDPRWKELERRIVLSQYVMRSNNAGSLPPAEIGLMGTDYWKGKFHMEMVWWHLAHYALWDRWELAEKALCCYDRFLPIARKRAAQMGHRGAKWGKKNTPDGLMGPWDGNLILNWQQPHPIFFAELEYRLKPTQETLDKWKLIISETADFMASYPVWDEREGVYHLEPIRTANENGDGQDTAFELAYWRWGLDHAQRWRERLGLQRHPDWDKVREKLAPLPVENGVYVFCRKWLRTPEQLPLRIGHPDPLGPFAFLPLGGDIDLETAQNTMRHIYENWNWNNVWGWDNPWAAMAAARTGNAQMAVDILLMKNEENNYSKSGICAGWYFPGNGGWLYAVAMMAAGWDGCPERHAPGFPDDGSWTVKWEGLKKAP